MEEIAESVELGKPAKDDHQWEETKAQLKALKPRELKKLVVGLQDDLKRMKTENAVFERFLQENEPSLIAGMDKTMKTLQLMQGQFVSTTSIKSGAGATPPSDLKLNEKVDNQNHSVTDLSNAPSNLTKKLLMPEKGFKGPRINYTLKTDLAMREIDTIQTNLNDFKEYAHRYKNRLRAEIEENEIRGDEIEGSRKEFEQQIVIDAVEELTQKIPAEKFVRYMQEWLKNSVFMLEKLRLRTNNLRGYLKKLKVMLIQKEEMGESVTEVDFEQLTISNKKCMDAIEEKNVNMIELKKINGKANLMLTKHKNMLAKQESFFKSMENQMANVKKQMELLYLHFERTQNELEESRKKIDGLKIVMKKYKVPEVMEYILKKNELEEYKKKMKVWKRKVNIQNIVMHTYVSLMRQFTNSPRVKGEWYTKKTFRMDDDFLPQDLTLITQNIRRRSSICSRKSSKFHVVK